MERVMCSYLEWQLNFDPSMPHDFIAFSKTFAASNLPQATPANHLPMRRLRMHNTTSKSRFCVCSSS